MSISVIIPNYNGEKLLKENLPSVIAAAKEFDGQGEIIVVDDASTDRSVSLLKTIEGITLLENEKNLGFSKTVNKAVDKAKGDILILLNSDVHPSKDFLKPLVQHFTNEKVFAVGCMDESLEGGKKILRGRGLGSWSKGMFIHKRGEVDRNTTLWVNGGSGAFRKSLWDTLGGFSPLFSPFYWEDIDLSYRAIKSGYKSIFEKKSVVTHQHEEGAIRSHYSQAQVKSISYRNQFIFIWKNITDGDLFISHILWLPYHFLSALLRFDVSFMIGFFRALILLPDIIQSRRANKLFKKSDKETVLLKE